MSKKKKTDKTLVEKILDKEKITYEPLTFATVKKGDVDDIVKSSVNEDEHLVYKTLVLTGNVTKTLVAVLPVDQHLSYKKLSKVSGNKKVGMVPLKNLVKTTGYVHGANTPIGIYEKYHYPIYIDTAAQQEPEIVVSAGKVGRSVKMSPLDLQKLVSATFADLIE